MKRYALLGVLTLFVLPGAAFAETPASPEAITVTRSVDGAGWDITLPNEAAKTLIDQLWLIVDGKSEGFGGGYFPGLDPSKPLHYTASVSSDLDGQVKDILKAQGFPIKANITTYHISVGLNDPASSSFSRTLTFRHECNVVAYTLLPPTATYKAGEKITIFDALALDSSVTMHDVLGSNDISTGKFSRLPDDLVHRITIQVQFVPKPPVKTAP